ncbi:zinc-binding protein A33-like [Solea senegalensis]|uniref:Zinc-binding protein A33-like n=1 Tax=Solea senegalensis TaxID=28829 RepID=A0AAV6QSS0_SOLSE|nr:zinc-binding protein A33-like [Solea senegalensis]
MAHRLKQGLTCPVCFDIFKDPVVLSCSHSFCKDCLQTWWADKVIRECPVCKRTTESEPLCNLTLKNLCEDFSQEVSLRENATSAPGDGCSLHSEKLRLFCLDHQQPVCVVCRDSKTHAKHRFRPIDEAAEEYRKRLRESLKPLQEKLERMSQVQVDWDLMEKEIKMQAQIAETRIKEEFKRLRCFLQQEEVTRIAALKMEEGQKSSVMRLRIRTLKGEISALSEAIRTTEQELKTVDVAFLHNFKATVKKVKQQPQQGDPQLAPGSLLDIAKHTGNLAYKIWDEMKDMVTYTPVILDPNTAERHLQLGEDLRSVTYDEKELARLKNPDRFDCFFTVLGSESINSGTLTWDVKVTEDANWAVGVITESGNRWGDVQTGTWEVWFDDNKYKAFAPPHTDKVLSVKKTIQRIQVHLDWNRGKLSFSDPLTNTNIYTFSQTFTERLFPFINTQSKTPLSILPVKIKVEFCPVDK